MAHIGGISKTAYVADTSDGVSVRGTTPEGRAGDLEE
jgi:hypothetical protein